jgi:hypothetical protein
MDVNPWATRMCGRTSSLREVKPEIVPLVLEFQQPARLLV